jgi:hypothetical protein
MEPRDAEIDRIAVVLHNTAIGSSGDDVHHHAGHIEDATTLYDAGLRLDRDRAAVPGLRAAFNAVGAAVHDVTGFFRCDNCGREERVGFARCLASGWPRCACTGDRYGYTMRLVTTKADIEEVVGRALAPVTDAVRAARNV